MIVAASPEPSDESALDAQSEALASSVVLSINTLLNGLPPNVQERVRAEIQKSFPENTKPRSREILATILKLVPRDREVTVDEVKKTVEAEGIQATAKGIADALGYLFRRQRITRLSHGRYMIEGMGELTTLEELDAGPPTRNMIDDY